MIDCLIWYEVYERSYENDLLLKQELAKRGFSVKIYNRYWVDYWKSLFVKPRLVLSPSGRTNADLAQDIPKRCHGRAAVLDMQEEQIAYSDDVELEQFKPTGKGVSLHHFSWGKFSRDYLASAGVSKDRIVPMKPIQFDLCDKAFDGYYASRESIAEEFGLDMDSRWILFASDFCFSVNYDTPEKREELYSSVEHIDYRAVIEEEDLTCAELYEWWDRYLSGHPKDIIIYRAHPSEFGTQKWVEELKKKYPNFVSIRKYSIKLWIHVIDVFTTWISSSIMEAYYADIPCFVLGNGDRLFSKGIGVPLIDKDKYLSQYEDFSSAMENPKEMSKEWNPVSLEGISKYYDQYEYRFAYMAIADHVEKILNSKDEYDKHIVALTKEEREEYLEKIKRYRKASFTNELVTKFAPLLKVVFPKKKEVVDAVLRETARFNRKEMKSKERKLKAIVNPKG